MTYRAIFGYGYVRIVESKSGYNKVIKEIIFEDSSMNYNSDIAVKNSAM